jgi:hypothetical protein
LYEVAGLEEKINKESRILTHKEMQTVFPCFSEDDKYLKEVGTQFERIPGPIAGEEEVEGKVEGKVENESSSSSSHQRKLDLGDWYVQRPKREESDLTVDILVGCHRCQWKETGCKSCIRYGGSPHPLDQKATKIWKYKVNPIIPRKLFNVVSYYCCCCCFCCYFYVLIKRKMKIFSILSFLYTKM